MSRSSAAVRLLLISVPLALSLPQVVPPFQVLNATAALSPTGTAEPAPIGTDVLIDPIPIEPGTLDDDDDNDIFGPGPVTIPLDPIFSDPLLPADFPDVDGPPHTVSVKTFLAVVQPLLDLISDLVPDNEPLVRHSRHLSPASLPKRSVQTPDPARNAYLIKLAHVVLEKARTLIAGLASKKTATPTVAPTNATSLRARQWLPYPRPPFPIPSNTPWGANPWNGKPPFVPSWVPAFPGAPLAAPIAAPGTESVQPGVESTSDSAPSAESVDSSSATPPAPVGTAAASPLASSSSNSTGPSASSTNATSDSTGPDTASTIAQVQHLLDVVVQLLTAADVSVPAPIAPVATKREISTALSDFYSALTNSKEKVETVDAFTATLKESFDELDHTSQAELLKAIAPELTRLDLNKRAIQNNRKHYSPATHNRFYKNKASTRPLTAIDFIQYFIAEFHAVGPYIIQQFPEIAEFLYASVTATVTVDDNFDYNQFPTEIQPFMLDLYVFLTIITDPTVSAEDRLSILQALVDGVDLGGAKHKRSMRRGQRKRQYPSSYDEGVHLDDAPKIGKAKLYAITGPSGSLDPNHQDQGYYASQSYQPSTDYNSYSAPPPPPPDYDSYSAEDYTPPPPPNYYQTKGNPPPRPSYHAQDYELTCSGYGATKLPPHLVAALQYVYGNSYSNRKDKK